MTSHRMLAALLAGTAAVSAQAQEAPTTDLAARFGALESVQQMSLSPGGGQVAYLTPAQPAGVDLVVADLATGATKIVLQARNPRDRLRWCHWASDVRLLCLVMSSFDNRGVLTGASRYVTLNSDGSDQSYLKLGTNGASQGAIQFVGDVLDWDLPAAPGHVLMTREFLPQGSIGTNIVNDRQGLGVEDFDLTTQKRTVVEPPRRTAVSYISDGRGNVRIMGTQATNDDGYVKSGTNWLYRRKDSKTWEQLSKAAGATDFTPIAVDPDRDVAYGFASKGDFDALYSVALDGSGKRTELLSRADVDVDDVVRIGRNFRVVGASYATERRNVEFFDPQLKALGAALGKALPGQPTISFIDSSQDESKLLMFAASDTVPGTFYVYDKATRHLAEVLPVRDRLDGVPLAPMKAITFPAGDGTQIPAYLTLPPSSTGKNLPAIVMPHGGPGARDEWGFDWLAQFYAARGYAVLQPNYRGSAGYGSGWYQRNGFQSWRTAIGDVNDAGRWLLKQGIAPADKLAIVGWSYGGYAALQSAVLDPNLFKAIVAVAPVTDLERFRKESEPFTNFLFVDNYIGRGPHVKEGSPAQNVDAIKAPVLMFHGTMDQNVGVGESRLMADKLKGAGKTVTYVEFDGLDHQLPDAAARSRVLRESDAFLRQAMKLPAD